MNGGPGGAMTGGPGGAVKGGPGGATGGAASWTGWPPGRPA